METYTNHARRSSFLPPCPLPLHLLRAGWVQTQHALHMSRIPPFLLPQLLQRVWKVWRVRPYYPPLLQRVWTVHTLHELRLRPP